MNPPTQSPAMHTPEVKIGTGLLALNLSTLCKNLVAAHRITQLEASCIENAVDAYAANQRTIEELRKALTEAAEIIEAKFGGRYVKARTALANSQTKEGQP